MLAVLVVKSVAGVRRIDNRIQVAAQSPRADSEIAAEIEQRLQWDVRVDGALITVDVREGRVTLSGSVGSARDVATATTLAWVQGVTAVDASGLAVEWWLRDELKPQRPSDARDDAQIKQAVQKTLRRDPRVSASDYDEQSPEGGRIVVKARLRRGGERRRGSSSSK
jgi:osmotically-inducible protein OsmY